MPISINQSMMREIIMDHYSSPRHKHEPKNAAEYQQIHMDSISCVDNIMLYVKVENDKVIDACFEGVACTISTASTDILCDLIIDKSKEDANYILNQYENMIFEKEFEVEYMPDRNLPYTVEKNEDGEYVVEGPRIEKMLGYTNLESEKGFNFFQKFLKENGILQALEEAGIQEGDTVRMYGLVFDYYK